MRRWMMWGIAAAACAAGVVQGQSVPQASDRSDSWQRPAAASSVAYGSGAVASSREGHGAFRFKDDDKSYDPRFQMSSPKRRYGRPDNICEANPTASTCRQAPPPRPGQGF